MESEESDISGYDSSDDEDYVPEGCTDEEEDIIDHKPKKVKSPKKRSPRKKRGGFRFTKDDSDESEDDVEYANEEEIRDDSDETNDEENEPRQDNKERINAIWKSFKNDTVNSDEKKQTTELRKRDDASAKTELDSKLIKKSDNDADVVPKNVILEESHSTEKDALTARDDESDIGDTISKQNKGDEKAVVSNPDSSSSLTKERKKRPGGLNSVLGSIGKKQKVSTLEKSKNDWDNFKKDRGIEDELRTGVKDGFLAKQEFLQRVDYRTWENEREMRLATNRGKK